MNKNRISMTRCGRGRPLVLLHGWGMSARVFEPIFQQLKSHRELILVDLPGYGSSHWDGTLSFEAQAAQIAEQLPKGEILGWSMGGLYAIEIVRKNLNAFDQLTLVCCNPCFVRKANWACAVDADVFDAFGEDLRHGWSKTIRRFLSLQMHGCDNARYLVKEMLARLEQGGEPAKEALVFGLNLLKTVDSRAWIAELDLPVKLILGGRDVLVPETLGEEISKVNPKIRVESLATAAHAPFLSHTEQFLSRL